MSAHEADGDLDRPSPAGCLLSLLLAPILGISLGLLWLFESWRGRAAAVWLLLGALGCVVLALRRAPGGAGVLAGAGWAAGVLVLGALAPGDLTADGSGSHGGRWLRFSPFNLVPEVDLVRVGLALFYPGAAGSKIWSVTEPLYREQVELPTAVSFTATDLGGLDHAFGWGASGQANDSRDQPGGLSDLHRLGAPLCAQLIKQPARMRLHRVFADE